MDDLISRKALIEELARWYKRLSSTDKQLDWIIKNELSNAMDIVNKAPSVEAEPVRHGEWIKMVFTDTGKFAGYKCSECGLGARKKFSYCHCGAKMDGGSKNASC